MQYRPGTGTLLEWARLRKASLERSRLPLEDLWREIRDNFEPTLGRALDNERDLNESAAKRADRKIINSKTRDVVSRLSSGLQSGITNQARQWFRLVDKAASGKDEPAGVRKAIDEATELLQTVIAGSNIYTQLISLYKRLGQFGTAAALLLPDDYTTVRLDVVDEGAYWLAQDRRGRVCTMLRRCEWTIAQIVEEFGESDTPETLVREWREGRGEEFRRVWNLVTPMRDVPPRHRSKFVIGAFASIYWIDSNDEGREPVALRSFLYNPIIAPRWDTPTGSVYGVGLGQIALPDAKGLQAFEMAKLKIVAQDADPAMAVPESLRGQVSGDLNAPGRIIYFASGVGGESAGHVPIQPVDARTKRLDLVAECIATGEQRLGRLFFEDLFAMLLQIQMGEGKRQMTATEVAELASEKIALLGPILTRLNHDLLNPLVGGIYAICREAAEKTLDQFQGLEVLGLAEPDDPQVLAAIDRYSVLADIENMDLQVEYTSTLHSEQMANSRIAGIVKTYEFADVIARYDAQVIDRLDGDEALKIGAKSYQEFGIIRDDEDVNTIREGRAAQQEQQMQMAQQQSDANVQAQQAKILKDIGEAEAQAGANAFNPNPEPY